MKSIVIAACMLALAFAASSPECKHDFAEGTKKYISTADGIVHDHTADLDLDGLEKCINDAARGCGQSVSKELGADYQNVDPDKLESCADDSMSTAQDKVQTCMNKDFPDVSFGTKEEQKESPGLRLIVQFGSLKQTYRTCRDVLKCVPDKYKELKAALCKAQTEAFGADFESRCGDVQKDVQAATCKCYKAVPDKQSIVVEFNTCCGVAQQTSLVGSLSSRVAQGGILKKIESNLCSTKDYQSKFGICEDDDLEKATKTSNTLGRLNKLVNGGSGGRGGFGSLFGGK